MARGPYFSLISQLEHRYPTLFYLTDWENRIRKSPKLYTVHASVLEFYEDGVKPVDFDSRDGHDGFEKLAEYLASPKSATQLQGRLFMLEDLSPEYIELLGTWLNIDGQVFAAHIRDAHWGDGNDWRHGHKPKLPSFNDPGQSFTVRYYETRYFSDPDMPKYSSEVKTLGNVSRIITLGTKVDKLGGYMGTIRRNASFWSHKENNGAWNGVLLLDPPITKSTFIFSTQEGSVKGSIRGSCDPYQGGYRDFIPWPNAFSLPLSDSKIRSRHLEIQGPHRTSLLYDLIYYWRCVASKSQIQSAIKSPYASTIFLRHLICSTWTTMLEHQHTILSESEILLRDDLKNMIRPHLSDDERDTYIAKVTEVLHEVNTLRRRTSWYLPEMKLNLEALGSSSEVPDSLHKEDQDFLAIYNRLSSHQAWAEKLMSLITTHVNLMETEKSISDSKSLERLTILGFFFVPVSFVCSFFSMNGDFAVGQPKLWVYFTVTIPLTFIILFLAFRKKWSRWWKKEIPRWKKEKLKEQRPSKQQGWRFR